MGDCKWRELGQVLRLINFIVASSWCITLPSFTMHGHMNVKFEILSLYGRQDSVTCLLVGR
jgi:hypothetical protein